MKRPRRNKIIERLEDAFGVCAGDATRAKLTTYLIPTRARARLRPDGGVEISWRPIVVPCR